MPMSRTHLLLAIGAPVLTVAGAGLLPFGMIGLLGFPITLIGLVLCNWTALASATPGSATKRSRLAPGIILCGVFLLGLGCLVTSVASVAWYDPPIAKHVFRNGREDVWIAIGLSVVAPALISQGGRMRSDAHIGFPLGWAIYWFMFYPFVIAAAVLYSVVITRFRIPITM